MDVKKYPRLGEELYHTVLDNGLNIYVDPKPEYGKYFAFFATHYGGMDTHFRLNGQCCDTPEGVAHFLEHKMFDTEDGNALQILAANGCDPNAFTSTDITGYHFQCTENFQENLKVLLSFVSVPWFTQESVDKEQGIIGQEIRMVEDTPDWRLYMDLLACLYCNNSAKTSVIGTQESIARITPDTLYACHKAFYDPSNMVLCVSGPVDPEEVADIAREILPKENTKPDLIRDHGAEEPENVVKADYSRTMEVSTPMFLLGFKADPPPEDGEGNLRQSLCAELALEILLGVSSPLYSRMYDEGLINKSFSWGYESYPGCAFLTAEGESRDPDAVRSAILQEAARLAEEGIDTDLFLQLKKALYGSKVRGLDSLEAICVELAQSHFEGIDWFTFPRVYDEITQDEVWQCLKRWFVPARTAMSTVLPD